MLRVMLLILIGLSSVLSGCSSQKPLSAAQSAARVAQPFQIYYTQFSLYQEQGIFRTTNYRKGTLIPINTAVSLLSLDTDRAVLGIMKSGEPLIIENVAQYTLDPMPIAFSKVVGTTKVDLAQFTDAEREAILSGQVKPGMRKKAVIAAIGYPPQHKTPSLDGNDWRYWANRFGTFVVHFNNDQVENIVQQQQ